MSFQIESRWLEPVPQVVPADLLPIVGQARYLAQGLLRQGLRSPAQIQAFLDPRRYQPSDPYDFPDMDGAVARLLRALNKKERIGVWGDFDVDGQTSTALLVSILRSLGADVAYHIPVRSREGHGVNLPYLQSFLEQGVQLVLTCDTGVTDSGAVEFCRQKGVDFIITDHHTLPDELPNAHALINPQRLPAAHPARTLSGVGTAFTLARALCAEASQPDLTNQCLDLAALGLVADVAILTGDARWMVQLGLEQLRSAQRLGLQKMFELAELNPANLTEEHIGFSISPRMNAIGRLADANPMVDFLTTSDEKVASVTAVQLEGLNGERRFLTEQVFLGALNQIEQNPVLLELPALLLSHPDWPAGVVGIVANRLVELFQRPVLLLSAPSGQPARGSARSIEGVNITEAIAAGKEFLLGYGGHPMAAGLSFEMQNLLAFQQRLNESVRRQLAGRALVKEIQIDAYLSLDQINSTLIDEVAPLAPFGPGNPPFVFATRDLHVVDSSPVGKTGEHLQVLVEDEKNQTRRLIWWQGAQGLLPAGKFDLAFTLRASNYRGQAEVQMEWIHARQAPEAAISLAGVKEFEHILDYRTVANPQAELRGVMQGDFLLWQEGRERLPEAVDRTQLRPASKLIIWNPPPGRAELTQALKTVKPSSVILFGVPYSKDSLSEFITSLTGMVRYAIAKKRGLVELSALAAALNQRTTVVEAGIRWLAARGYIRIVADNLEQFELIEGGIPDNEKSVIMQTALRSILQETAAFRAFYMRANPKILLKTNG